MVALQISPKRVKYRVYQSRISPEILEQFSSNLAQEIHIIKRNKMTATMLLPWKQSWLQSLSVKK